MSRYDQALRLFEEMDGLDDAFIEEAMLPDGNETPARPRFARGKHPFGRLAKSGWGAAAVCGAVVIGLLAASIGLGTNDSKMEADDAGQQNSPSYGPSDSREEELMPEGGKPDTPDKPFEEPSDGSETDTAEDGT